MAATDVHATGRTKGREATQAVIPGRYALSVGMPNLPAPRGWRWTALSEVAQLESGHTPSRKHPEYWNGGIPWIGIKDAVDNHGREIEDTYQKVSALGLQNSSARLLPAKTVCLSRTASVGYVIMMGRPMATSQDFVNWVCGPQVVPEYLKYILTAENEALFRFASGTTHQTIYYPEAKAFHALLPPPAEQRAIARILGSLDDKIELNRRLNETLEAMARALFKSWFVDFDPVRSKMRGEQPAGMDAATAALFPSRLVKTEHGEIPEGWTVQPLGDAASYLSRGIGPTYVEAGGVLVLNQKCVRAGTIDFTKGRRHDSSARAVDGRDVRLWDALINSTGVGTLGRVAVVRRIPEPFVVDSHVTVVRGSERLDPVVLSTSLAMREPEIEALGEGSTGQTELSRSRLGQLPIIVPEPSVQRAARRIVEPLLSRCAASEREALALTELRDAMLPRLLSGELRVREAEQVAEEAA